MSYLEANGLPVLVGRMSFPSEGAWTASLDINAADLDAFEDGPVTIASTDGVFALVGTVWTPPGGAARAGTTLGKRTTVAVVGGAGGLAETTTPKGYTTSPVRLPLTDIMLAAGEELSTTVTAAVLDYPIGRWTLPALRCDTALRRLAEVPGLVWRVLPDGTVWLGEDAYEALEIEHSVISEAPEAARMVVAPAYGAEAVMPGVTFRDRRVSFVVHSVDEMGLRSDVTFESGDRLRAALERIVDRRVDQRGLPFAFPYSAKVVSQNANGTLELVLDDASMPKLSGVPYYLGIPGAEVVVTSEARCFVSFANGDARRPFVSHWERDGLSEFVLGPDADSIDIADGTMGAARVNDPVQAGPYAGTIVMGSTKVTVG